MRVGLPRPTFRSRCSAHARRTFLSAPLLLASLAATAAAPVSLEGLDGDVRRAVLREAGDPPPCDARDWVARNHLRDVESAVRTMLRARGHYRPRLTTTLARDGDCWAYGLDVDEGPRATLARLDLRVTGAAAGNEALTRLLEDTALEEGEPFREADYVSLKERLLRRALELGYFDSAYEKARVDVYPERSSAEVVLHLETGGAYEFGELTVEFDRDPPPLYDRVVDRLADWVPGLPYSLQRIQNLRQRLSSSGYFETVDVRTDPDAAVDGVIPVTVHLEMRERHQISGGVGYATDIGPRLQATYDDFRANADGHQGSIRLNLSPVIQEITGSWRLPIPGQGDPWLLLDTGEVRQRTDDIDSRAFSIALRRIHGGPLGFRMTESLEFTREEFEVAGDDDVATLLIPSVTLVRSEQYETSPLEIGWRVETGASFAGGPIATTDFVQFELGLEGAAPLGARSRVIGRAEGVVTFAEKLSELPSTVRQFAGGDQSIRGYGLFEVGPEGDNGEVRGGRHLLVGSLEVERMVRERWSVAAFADAGGAFNSFIDPLVTSVGVGVRWQSPFGPLRVDLAFPQDDEDRVIRFHVGVGHTFR